MNTGHQNTRGYVFLATCTAETLNMIALFRNVLTQVEYRTNTDVIIILERSGSFRLLINASRTITLKIYKNHRIWR